MMSMRTNRIAVGVLGGLLAATLARAALVEMAFQDDGAVVGSNLTSTANSGTDGDATATGAALGGGSLTYTTGPGGGQDLAALFSDANAAGETYPEGGRIQLPNVTTTLGAGGNSDWSIMFAIRLDGEQVIFDRALDGMADVRNNGYTIALSSGAQNYAVQLVDGEWTHLAMTAEHRAGSGLAPDSGTHHQVRWYVNGVEVSESPYIDSIERAIGTLTVGCQPSGWRPLGGAIDDIMIFDSLLGPTEVAAQYTASFTSIPEPASALLLGLLGLVARRRRK